MSLLTHASMIAPAAPAAGKIEIFSDSADGQRLKSVQTGGRIEVLPRRSLAENFLVNGGFRFAQRQAPGTLTSYALTSGRTFGADRFGMTIGASSIQYQRIDSIAATESGLNARYYGKFKQITGSSKLIVSQVIEAEDSAQLRGRVVRFQAKMKYSVAASMTVRMGLLYLNEAGTLDTIPATFASPIGAAGTDPTWGTNLVALLPSNADGGTVNTAPGNGMDCVLTTSWVRYSATFVVPFPHLNLIPVIWTNGLLTANDELNITEVGLYDGQEIIDWSPCPIAREMVRIERYYQKTFAIDTAPATTLGTNTGELQFQATKAGALQQVPSTYVFRTKLRTATPTVTTFNTGAANAQVRDTSVTGDCSGTAVNTTESGAHILCTGNVSTAIDDKLNVHVTFDAEM
jgi:hypothetical protein